MGKIRFSRNDVVTANAAGGFASQRGGGRCKPCVSIRVQSSTLLIALWLIILANFSGDELRSCFRNSRRGLLDVRRSLSGLVTPRTPKEGGGGDVPVEAGAVQAAPVARI